VDSLLFATTDGAVGDASILVLVVVLVAAGVVVLAGRDPEVAVTRLLHGSVLVGKIDSLTLVAVVAAALGKSAGAGGKGRADGSVLLDPVGERVLAVLDDARMVVSITRHSVLRHGRNLRLASLVAVVCVSGLSRGDGGVVNELQEVLAVSSNDGHLLRVLTESVELVGEGSLQLLTGDVGELGLGDQ
jgi:hypothetical protein